MADSLSRRLARFASGLDYGSLPVAVVDKARALLLHNLVMACVSREHPAVEPMLQMVLREDSKPDGATVLTHGGHVTRSGAAFANSFILQATNQADSYNMLVHPGPCVIPAVLATAELEHASGRDVITALVAGFEVECRIAGPFLPSTQARGFRSSSVYGSFGAATGAGKVRHLDEEAMTGALAWASAFTAGLGEGAHPYHEANATRNGVLASLIAHERTAAAERALDGAAGFYNAFTGNAAGNLSYSFFGPKQVELSSVADELGQRWEMLHITPKIPPTPGYAIPVIELLKALRRDHAFAPDDIESIQVLMNWLETTYPSPAYVEARPGAANRPGGTAYIAATVCVHGDYPLHGIPAAAQDDPAVLSLLARTEILGVWDRRPFAPRITIRMRDGRTLAGEYRGDELEWDWDTELRNLRPLFAQIDWPTDKLEAMVDTVARLDTLAGIDGLIRLCVP